MKILILTILLGNGIELKYKVDSYEECERKFHEISMPFEVPIMEGKDIIGYEFNGSVTQWKGNIYQVVFYSCLIESKEDKND